MVGLSIVREFAVYGGLYQSFGLFSFVSFVVDMNKRGPSSVVVVEAKNFDIVISITVLASDVETIIPQHDFSNSNHASHHHYHFCNTRIHLFHSTLQHHTSKPWRARHLYLPTPQLGTTMRLVPNQRTLPAHAIHRFVHRPVLRP